MSKDTVGGGIRASQTINQTIKDYFKENPGANIDDLVYVIQADTALREDTIRDRINVMYEAERRMRLNSIKRPAYNRLKGITERFDDEKTMITDGLNDKGGDEDEQENRQNVDGFRDV